ncbi:dihydroxyacetone kinase subunit DhaL [Paraliobacillus sediminis]|uniref:dihydroxyacetone kinase subunit DhaL n=1 Tax=Paraliobacillus sediminis TaxID=1885916 RepID=UPI000E3DC468|nr:dihydroxyacetone kinase subunit DhaL [Paraliobacillus sediminis]
MLTVENTIVWLRDFAEKIETEKGYLSELDSVIGDGDHGSNMARGVTAMVEKLDQGNFSSVEEVFKVAAMALLGKIGGASGPLYGSALLDMAKASGQDTTDIGLVVSAGLTGIQKRGKAEVGEKTMVDVWSPVAEQLATKSLTRESVEEIVDKTKAIKATKGRASYLGDRSIGNLDPGAVSSGYFFLCLLKGDIINGL